VLTASVVARSEELLATGGGEAEVAETLGLKLNTLQKAIWSGRVRGYVEGAIQAASYADAVLYLISPWTLQSEFQSGELPAGRGRVVPASSMKACTLASCRRI
jgi:hypothetical protein